MQENSILTMPKNSSNTPKLIKMRIEILCGGKKTPDVNYVCIKKKTSHRDLHYNWISGHT